jgi:hypothetical protein
MRIWNHLQCRWVTWHGTKAVWLTLPHAIGGLACVVAAAFSLAALPLGPASHQRSATQPLAHDVRTTSLPMAPETVAYAPSVGSEFPGYAAGIRSLPLGSPFISQAVSMANSEASVLPVMNNQIIDNHTAIQPTNSDSQPTDVPEPSSLVMLGTAVLGIYGAMRRRAASISSKGRSA